MSEIHCDSLWYGADIVTMRDGKYHLIQQGAMAVTEGKIVWIGPYRELPAINATREVVYQGGLITPDSLIAILIWCLAAIVVLNLNSALTVLAMPKSLLRVAVSSQRSMPHGTPVNSFY